MLKKIIIIIIIIIKLILEKYIVRCGGLDSSGSG
jgi:hypothetical protein